MSNKPLGSSSVTACIDHANMVARDIGSLYMNDEYSDITLCVDGQKFLAHKVILAVRSHYFRALLYGGMKESRQSEVEIIDANVNAFTILLKYVYTGVINLSLEKEETVLELLGLAHQYGFEDMEFSVCEHLKGTLRVPNVCGVYDVSCLYNLVNLKCVCEDFMDKNALSVINHESFQTLSPDALKYIVARDSFCATEVQIFQAVYEWTQKNPEIPSEQLREILLCIRLSLIPVSDLLNIVRPTGLMTPDQILDAIKNSQESKDGDRKYRGFLLPCENVAVPSKGAQVLQGEMRNNLLDGNSVIYDMDRGFTRHPIDENNGQGILVKLGGPYIVNHMRLLLWDRDARCYSYYIEVSMDQKDWVRVVDHTEYHCRSWQFLHFAARVVKFIRIVGTNNTVNRVFHAVIFEAFYKKVTLPLVKGIVVPTENIATVHNSALVIEGVSRTRNNLLNGNLRSYDWDTGYTCHQLGSGAIVIQLGQPYWLSSCKLLLWDCDDRTYSYYIEASVNGRDWEVIVDRTHEPCRSWQTLKFPDRAIVYFKIIGTFNSANEVFHCVHFECPAQPDSEIRTNMAISGNSGEVVNPHRSDRSAMVDVEPEEEGEVGEFQEAARWDLLDGDEPPHAVGGAPPIPLDADLLLMEPLGVEPFEGFVQ